MEDQARLSLRLREGFFVEEPCCLEAVAAGEKTPKCCQ